MLIPRRVKYRKQHHPNRRGMAKGGTELAFGEFGVQALEPAYMTNRQIEAARIAMTRYIKRGGKVWINVYPDRPLTKHPAESRMGSGKVPGVLGCQRQARSRALRARRRDSGRRQRGTASGHPQAAFQGTHHHA